MTIDTSSSKARGEGSQFFVNRVSALLNSSPHHFSSKHPKFPGSSSV